jgi:hypothetical protein
MVAADAAADLAAVTAAGLLSYYSAAVAASAVAAETTADAAADLAAADALALSGLSSCFAAAVDAATIADAARNANKYVIRLLKWRRFDNHKGIALTYTIKVYVPGKWCGRAYPDKSPLFLPRKTPFTIPSYETAHQSRRCAHPDRRNGKPSAPTPASQCRE